MTTSLRLESGVAGARAGLLVLGIDYAWIGLVQNRAGVHLACRRMATAQAEDTIADDTMPRHPLDSTEGSPTVSVRATTDRVGLLRFSWSIDDRATWHRIAQPFQAAPGQWIGAEIGLFACAPVRADRQRNEESQGSAVFHAVEFAIKPVSDEGTL